MRCSLHAHPKGKNGDRRAGAGSGTRRSERASHPRLAGVTGRDAPRARAGRARALETAAGPRNLHGESQRISVRLTTPTSRDGGCSGGADGTLRVDGRAIAFQRCRATAPRVRGSPDRDRWASARSRNAGVRDVRNSCRPQRRLGGDWKLSPQPQPAFAPSAAGASRTKREGEQREERRDDALGRHRASERRINANANASIETERSCGREIRRVFILPPSRASRPARARRASTTLLRGAAAARYPLSETASRTTRDKARTLSPRRAGRLGGEGKGAASASAGRRSFGPRGRNADASARRAVFGAAAVWGQTLRAAVKRRLRARARLASSCDAFRPAGGTRGGRRSGHDLHCCGRLLSHPPSGFARVTTRWGRAGDP